MVCDFKGILACRQPAPAQNILSYLQATCTKMFCLFLIVHACQVAEEHSCFDSFYKQCTNPAYWYTDFLVNPTFGSGKKLR